MAEEHEDAIKLLLKIARIAQHFRAHPPAPEDLSLRSPMELAILGEVDLLREAMRERG